MKKRNSLEKQLVALMPLFDYLATEIRKYKNDIDDAIAKFQEDIDYPCAMLTYLLPQYAEVKKQVCALRKEIYGKDFKKTKTHLS